MAEISALNSSVGRNNKTKSIKIITVGFQRDPAERELAKTKLSSQAKYDL